jgi:hypothetical protein
MFERDKNIESEWQSSVIAEISKANANISNQQLETIQRVIKFQKNAVENLRKLLMVCIDFDFIQNLKFVLTLYDFQQKSTFITFLYENLPSFVFFF